MTIIIKYPVVVLLPKRSLCKFGEHTASVCLSVQSYMDSWFANLPSIIGRS
jgi:hypothetical protein